MCGVFMGRKPRKHKSSGQKTYRSAPPRRKSKSRKPLYLGLIFCIAVASIVIYSMARQGGDDVEVDKDLSNQNTVKSNIVLLETSMGNITIELYDDMPITVNNFKRLTENGVYDGTIFHRVVHDFVIQGGDASSKGINVPTIEDELPNKHSNIRGSVAMAKTSEPNSATSQFYINLKDNPSLDSNYSVFGRVIEGMDVVDAIGDVKTSNEKPLQDVTLKKAQLID